MLTPINQLDEQTRMDMLFKRVDAYDPDTGANMHVSHGNSRGAPKWFLFFGDMYDADGEWRPYREWRTIFRAWSLAEAIEIGNQKLAKLVAKGKVCITERMV